MFFASCWFLTQCPLKKQPAEKIGGGGLPVGQGRSSRWPYVRRQAWDRDRHLRAPCHICGERIDYSLKPSSAPNSWEPDHIIPFAQAPELELDLANIAPAHKRCNRERGDGKNNDLGMQSRIW